MINRKFGVLSYLILVALSITTYGETIDIRNDLKEQKTSKINKRNSFPRFKTDYKNENITDRRETIEKTETTLNRNNDSTIIIDKIGEKSKKYGELNLDGQHGSRKLKSETMNSEFRNKLWNIKLGYRGPKGYRGDKGYKGDDGDKGAIGYRGPKGYRGDKGYKGVDGDKGAIGYRGPKGYRGDKGYKGVDGDKGAIGYRGSKGYRGDKGYKGDNGDKGAIGYRGPKGYLGDKGYKGEKGPYGHRGPEGYRGKPGLNGLDGADVGLDFIHGPLRNEVVGTTTFICPKIMPELSKCFHIDGHIFLYICPQYIHQPEICSLNN